MKEQIQALPGWYPSTALSSSPCFHWWFPGTSPPGQYSKSDFNTYRSSILEELECLCSLCKGCCAFASQLQLLSLSFVKVGENDSLVLPDWKDWYWFIWLGVMLQWLGIFSLFFSATHSKHIRMQLQMVVLDMRFWIFKKWNLCISCNTKIQMMSFFLFRAQNKTFETECGCLSTQACENVFGFCLWSFQIFWSGNSKWVLLLQGPSCALCQ